MRSDRHRPQRALAAPVPTVRLWRLPCARTKPAVPHCKVCKSPSPIGSLTRVSAQSVTLVFVYEYLRHSAFPYPQSPHQAITARRRAQRQEFGWWTPTSCSAPRW